MRALTATAFLLTILITNLISVSKSQAGEPDDFMARADKKAPIANEYINRGLNYKLGQMAAQYKYAITDAGSKEAPSSCSPEKLRDIVANTFDRNFPDIYDLFGSSEAYDLTAGPKTYDETPMTKWIPKHHKMWVPSYRVRTSNGEFVMGVDKIDHFFAHGYLNHLAVNETKTGTRSTRLRKALEFNRTQEHGFWGLRGTKVKSYADIAASELGIQFWENLTNGKDPVFVCENGLYMMKKPFDLFKYLDPSVDESINCNSYPDKATRDVMVGHAEKVGAACPAAAETCKKLVALKKTNADLTLHPLCRGEAHSQIEETSSLSIEEVLRVGSALTTVDNLFPFWFGRSQAHSIKKKSSDSQNTIGDEILLEPSSKEPIETPKSSSQHSPQGTAQ